MPLQILRQNHTATSKISHVLETDFQIVAKMMRAEFQLAEKRANSAGEIGQAREALVRNFLQEYLPVPWAVGSGFVRDANGKSSKQIDVIVNYDSILKGLPYEKKRKLYFAESVGAIVSVKSTLTKTTLRDAVYNVWSAKQLRRSSVKGQERVMSHYEQEVAEIIPGMIFAFQSKVSLRASAVALTTIIAELGIPEKEQPDVLVVLDVGHVVNVAEKEDRFKAYAGDKPGVGIVMFNSRENALLELLLLVMRYLPQHVFVPSASVLSKYYENPRRYPTQ